MNQVEIEIYMDNRETRRRSDRTSKVDNHFNQDLAAEKKVTKIIMKKMQRQC